jgi:hypothetical protein
MNNLRAALKRQGKDEAAEEMHRQVLDRREKALGPESHKINLPPHPPP